MQTDYADALDNAKIHLLLRPDSVFLTTILFSLRFIEDSTVPTACTNGTYIKINPDFFLKLDRDERVFLLAHEAYHVAFQHMVRVNDRDFRKWNIATDYVINDMLIQQGMKMPKGGLHNIDYRGYSSYEVYDLLDDNDLPDSPDDMEAVAGDAATVEKIEQEIRNTVIKATIKAKEAHQAGTIPGEITVFIDKLLKPKLPWHKILHKQLNTLTREDYTFTRLNRRYLPDYLPSLNSPGMGEIAVAVDVSGSITQLELDSFLTEIFAIHKTLRPKATNIIAFDTRITGIFRVTKDKDIVNVKMKGGGGTHIEEVYDWVKENKPLCFTVFTDGYFDTLPDQAPRKIPMFWVIHKQNEQFEAPTGKVITFNQE